MYSLRQIYNAVDNITALGGEKEEVSKSIEAAMESLKNALDNMDRLHVCGRFHVDTLLGCMMGLEAIIGEGENNA